MDFPEGESELIVWFNAKYGPGGFALLTQNLKENLALTRLLYLMDQSKSSAGAKLTGFFLTPAITRKCNALFCNWNTRTRTRVVQDAEPQVAMPYLSLDPMRLTS